MTHRFITKLGFNYPTNKIMLYQGEISLSRNRCNILCSNVKYNFFGHFYVLNYLLVA